MNNEGYFNGGDGVRYRFTELAKRIRREHPSLIGAHIFRQLDALGLRHVFERGETPIPLPRSFTD